MLGMDGWSLQTRFIILHHIKRSLILQLQAMGRIGEVICRTWQTADKMKRFRGQLGEEKVLVKI